MLPTPAQIKTETFESRRNLFLPGVDTSHEYVRACLISTQTFRRALTTYVDSGVVKPFSGVTNSGRVWREVPESDARSVRSEKSRFPASFLQTVP